MSPLFDLKFWLEEKLAEVKKDIENEEINLLEQWNQIVKDVKGKGI